jgi:transposase
VILRSACRQLTAVETEVEEIEAELAHCVADVPAVQVLLTITGVGLIGAATWAIVGDPRRFARGKQVTRYAGLDPSIVQSGDQRRQGRISKTGSPVLRTLLVEAAHALARWDTGPLGQFYTRKARQVGPRNAIIALARKLLIVAWRMLLTAEVYRTAKPTAVARKQRELQKKLIRVHTQPPAVLPSHPMGMTQLPTSHVAGTEGIMSRRRTSVSA